MIDSAKKKFSMSIARLDFTRTKFMLAPAKLIPVTTKVNLAIIFVMM